MLDGNLNVVKHNILIDHEWLDDFTLFDQQFVSACVAQIPMDAKEIGALVIDVDDLYQDIHGYSLRGERRDSIYSELLALMKRRIRLRDTVDPNGEHNFVWFTHIYRNEETGEFTATINRDLVQYLIGLEGGSFTLTKFQEHKDAETSIGLKLFEIMSRYGKHVNEKIFSIEDLKTIFNLQGKYERVYDFKKFVLDPAIEDINNFSQKFTLSYEQRKTRRRVTHIKFTKHKRDKPLEKNVEAPTGFDVEDIESMF